MSVREISEFRLNLREKAADDCEKKIKELEEHQTRVREAKGRRQRELQLLDSQIKNAVKGGIITGAFVDQCLQEWATNTEVAQTRLAEAHPEIRQVLVAIAKYAAKVREDTKDIEWFSFTDKLIVRLKYASKIWKYDAARARNDLQEIDLEEERLSRDRALALSKLSEIIIDAESVPRKGRARGAVVQAHAEGVHHTADEEAILDAITF